MYMEQNQSNWTTLLRYAIGMIKQDEDKNSASARGYNRRRRVVFLLAGQLAMKGGELSVNVQGGVTHAAAVGEEW